MNKTEQFVHILKSIEALEIQRIRLRDQIIEEMKENNLKKMSTEHGTLHLHTYKEFKYPIAIEEEYKRAKASARHDGTAGYVEGTPYLTYEIAQILN